MCANAVMVALPNISSAFCSTPQSLPDAHCYMPCSNAAKKRNLLKFVGVPKLPNRSQPLVRRSLPYYEDVEDILLLNEFLQRAAMLALLALY